MTEKEKKLCEENYNLVRYTLIHRLHIPIQELDEYHGTACIALCEAAMAYVDEVQKKSKFSPYAVQRIYWRVLNDMKKKKRKNKNSSGEEVQVLSFDRTYEVESSSSQLSMWDFVEDPMSKDWEDEVESRLVIDEVLTQKEKALLYMRLSGCRYREIGKRQGYSGQRAHVKVTEIKQKVRTAFM